MVSSFLRNVFIKTMKITVQSFLFSSEIMTENNAKLWKPNEVNPSLGKFAPTVIRNVSPFKYTWTLVEKMNLKLIQMDRKKNSRALSPVKETIPMQRQSLLNNTGNIHLCCQRITEVFWCTLCHADNFLDDVRTLLLQRSAPPWNAAVSAVQAQLWK